jgi:uroporphyrin-III C-methyltransferase/precorrin-2 dehydrogenase/sirohydrochlorin ferrochelatase
MTRALPPETVDGEGPPIMTGLAALPLFFNLKGRRAVIAGGSNAALWKAELIQAAGADLHVFSAAPCAGLVDLARRRPPVTLVRRPFQADDLKGAALAVADVETMAQAEEFRAAACACGVPANIIDKPLVSDFQFGAIVDRSPLVVAISTGGASPVLAQAVRGRIEAVLPAAIKLWAAAAKRWREPLKAREPAAKLRRRFWELFAAKALVAGSAPPGENLFADLLTETAREGASASKGMVALVGAGPGDPELVTVKAVRMLRSADVVLYDDLVSPAIVDMARREAQKIPVGKRGYRPSCDQDHIVALMIGLASEGKRIVRLKGGDPMVFARATEEISALRAAGVAIEVVPGITAALGAAASLQVSLTERDKARRLQFITAHAHDGRLPEDIDWRALCDPRASSVVYMGGRTLGVLAERLLAHGIDPATPALLVERASCPDERRITGTIATLPAKALAEAPSGPCLILIGAVFASSAESESDHRPAEADASRAQRNFLHTALFQ